MVIDFIDALSDGFLLSHLLTICRGREDLGVAPRIRFEGLNYSDGSEVWAGVAAFQRIGAQLTTQRQTTAQKIRFVV